MKKHIRIKNTNYCLCGLSVDKVEPVIYNDSGDLCMSCGYMARGLLGFGKDIREFHKVIRKLKNRLTN
jgi:hypothetical protein